MKKKKSGSAPEHSAESKRAAARRESNMEPPAEKPEKPKKSHKKLKLVLCIVLVVAALLAAGATAGGYFVTKSEVNLPKVKVEGIDVGGMTKEETAALLAEKQWDEDAAIALRVKLPAGVSFKIDPCRAGAKLTEAGAVEAAYRYGHSGNLYENLLKYIANLLIPVDVAEANTVLDESYIRSCIEKGTARFETKTADKGYVVDEQKNVLRMVKGAGQMKIDEDKLFALVSQALLSGERLVDHTNIDSSLTMPDFEAIYKELCVEPVDAYFEEGTFEVVKEVVGCSFDITAAQSAWQAAQPAETVEIPLVITYPEKTAEYLESLLFRDKLGSQTTYFTWSTSNRINNIQLASSAIDGLILMPGEVFSYNETVGQRTAEAGYLAAGAYNDGQVVQEIGGGICQVSSTLYCAAMLSQLETVERTSHYFPVDYLTWGLDATVSWPGPDFKFKNSREYPVKIVAYCDTEEKSITFEIWGTDVDGSYVELWHNMGCIYDDEYTDVIVGYGVNLYRSVYDKDGNHLYDVKEPYGVYNLHDEDINWPDPEPSPEPTVSPETGGSTEPEPDYSGEATIIPPQTDGEPN